MILKSKGKIEFDSNAVKFGVGLFETMLFKENRIIFLDQHIKRLFNSSEKLDIGREYIASLIDEILSFQYDISSEGIIRISLYECGYSIEMRELLYVENSYNKGFRICSYPYSRGNNLLFRHKTTSYLSNLEARKYANQRGYDEALIYENENNILEGSYTNIFCKKGNDFFFVSENSSFLEGVASQNIMKVLINLGFNIIKEVININQLKSSDNVFVSNSAMNMMGVTAIDDTVFNNDSEFCFKVNNMLIQMDKNGFIEQNKTQENFSSYKPNCNNQKEVDINLISNFIKKPTNKKVNINLIMDFIKEKYNLKEKYFFVFLTGSSRDLLFSKEKDIDIFIIDEVSDIQIRDLVEFKGYELDVNMISEKLLKSLVKLNEGFIVKALKNSTYIEGNYEKYKEYK